MSAQLKRSPLAALGIFVCFVSNAPPALSAAMQRLFRTASSSMDVRAWRGAFVDALRHPPATLKRRRRHRDRPAAFLRGSAMSSVASVGVADAGADAHVSMLGLDSDSDSDHDHEDLSVGDRVEILAGKYQGTHGVVLDVADGKVQVRRDCRIKEDGSVPPELQSGHERTYRYPAHQVRLATSQPPQALSPAAAPIPPPPSLSAAGEASSLLLDAVPSSASLPSQPSLSDDDPYAHLHDLFDVNLGRSITAPTTTPKPLPPEAVAEGLSRKQWRQERNKRRKKEQLDERRRSHPDFSPPLPLPLPHDEASLGASTPPPLREPPPVAKAAVREQYSSPYAETVGDLNNELDDLQRNIGRLLKTLRRTEPDPFLFESKREALMKTYRKERNKILAAYFDLSNVMFAPGEEPWGDE
ncbi:unnamed protein product [Vitrella brassicaformis CCMP3155]|uniref:KOW domain-containing protein n=1 Tax=Vitrella brassicaformis (strain CCMP3155) TaxID=1169540 RepID=A0A0G4FGM0_VITBC|nr:unnamed protein product [Vitrella brassicaformis CCMP3155]|eukprot:CEM12003.1 unnamed protein product [Vitrella brassicaformis CCMP3155]